jgi:Zn-dependent M28 family amino/carboxypeptidase
MKIITVFFSLCVGASAFAQLDLNKWKKYMEMITAPNLSASLHFLASDYFKGRGSGTDDEKAVASYLATSYIAMGLPPLNNASSKAPQEKYYQPFEYTSRSSIKKSQNVIAVLEGNDPVLKKEAIIIIAHYDHLGMDTTLPGDQVFNGAGDDGSGTVALLQIARSFVAARERGEGPQHSIIFFHAGAEEAGLRGSTHYVNREPLWPLDHTAAVINLDGIGGTDVNNLGDNHNYVYILRADSTSSHLYNRVKQLNKDTNIELEILYPKNAQQFTSDNRPFVYELIPAVYFSTGFIENYHKVTDEAGTIDYGHMTKIAKLVFALSWDLSMNKVKSTFNRRNYMKSDKDFFCIPCGCSKDNIVFSGPGHCDDCGMELVPFWKKKNGQVQNKTTH